MADSILLVDDAPNVEATVAAVLRNDGFDVTTAVNPTAARMAMQGHPFDLVISEQAFDEPGDGLALLQLARQRDRSGTIVLTGYGSEHAENMARDSGIHHYLRKPCSIEILKKMVRQAIAEAQGDGPRRVVEEARSPEGRPAEAQQ